jgi:hypothetical protein
VNLKSLPVTVFHQKLMEVETPALITLLAEPTAWTEVKAGS